MRVLLDTNIILRRTNPAAPEYTAVVASLQSLVVQGHTCCVCAQNLVELWAVMTRPLSSNGLALDPGEARRRIDTVLASLTFVHDPPVLFMSWLDLCTTHEVRGRQVFDARLVALMVGTGIDRFVTLTPVDFTRYPMIELIVPGAGGAAG